MTTTLQLDSELNSTAQPLKDQSGKTSSLNLSTDSIGIGTATPKAKLHVTADIIAGSDKNGQKFLFHSRTNGDGDFLQITADDANGNWQFDKGLTFVRSTGNFGIGTTNPQAKLDVTGNIALNGSANTDAFFNIAPSDVSPNAGYIRFGDNTGWKLHFARSRESSQINGTPLNTGATGVLMTVQDNGNVGIGTTNPTEKLEVNGSIKTNGDILLTNADCAEDFDICETENVEAGTVMVLGEEGVLYPSQQAYDKRVAGVVSGAGQYKPGIVLDKQDTGKLRKPIALMGKVYCKVDAEYGDIEIGDLLTTSPTPGHAMKVSDPLKAFGTVIGKALRPFSAGQGLVPVLIALQ